MKNHFERLIILFFLAIITFGCTPQNPAHVIKAEISENRPENDYALGKWHNQISEAMTNEINQILVNLGFSNEKIEINVLPAKTNQDELIIIFHTDWNKSNDLSQLFFWLFSSIKTYSEKYHLNSLSTIVVTCEDLPCGEFDIENKNIQGFCEVPNDGIDSYINEKKQDMQSFQKFLSKWDCSFKATDDPNQNTLIETPTATQIQVTPTKTYLPFEDPSYTGRPTLFPPENLDCVFWERIKKTDVGRNLCIYGKVGQVSDNYFLLGGSITDSIMVLVKKEDHPYFTGDCLTVSGKVGTIQITDDYSPLIISKPEMEKYGTIRNWCYSN